MNWTEGTLARHSRRKGRNPGLARQKEYFAKARAGQKHTGSSHSGFVPSYIRRLTPQEKSSSAFQPPTISLLPTPRSNAVQSHRFLSIAQQNTADSSSAHPTGSPHAQSHGAPQASIQDKRRKLLEQDDWTGVNLPKLPEVDFKQMRHACSPKRSRKAPLSAASSRHEPRQVYNRPNVNVMRTGLHKAQDAGSIRLRIGDHRLRWSQNGGSMKSAHTLRAASNANSPSVAASMPSSPPIQFRGLSSSSPTTRIRTYRPEFASRGARLRQKQHTQLLEGVPAPAVMSTEAAQCNHSPVAENTLLEVPAQVQGYCSVASRPIHTETESASIVADPGHSPEQSVADKRLNAEWQAFVENVATVDEDLYVGRERRSNSRCCSREHSAILPSTSNALTDNVHIESPYFHPSIDRISGSERSLLNPATQEDDDDYLRTTQNCPIEPRQDNDLGHTTPNIMEAWTQEPDVREMLLMRSGPQNMLLLPEPRLNNTKVLDIDPGVATQPSNTDEEELWKRFMLDDDPDSMREKAQQTAVKETVKQMWEGRMLRSDEVEVSSTLPIHACSTPNVTEQTSEPVIPDTHEPDPDFVSCTADKASSSIASNVAERGSPSQRKADPPTFRVHVPAPFVGRLADSAGSETDLTAHSRAPCRRHMSRRAWKSMRPQIRAIPGFDDDPIEEET